MEPTIIEKGEMLLVGMASDGHDIHGLWMRFMEQEEQITQGLPGVAYEVHTHVHGAPPSQLQECFVGVEVTAAAEIPAGMLLKRLPPARYAVFTHCLANGGYTGANAEMTVWLQAGPYRHIGGYSIQRFDDRFNGGNQPDSAIDFLIPIAARR